MKRLVEFPLESGGTVLVEVQDTPDTVRRGLGEKTSDVAQQATSTFEEATGSVAPAALSLITRLRGLENPPDEIGVQFGVKLSADAKAFIASISAEANFQVSMTWRASPARVDPAGE